MTGRANPWTLALIVVGLAVAGWLVLQLVGPAAPTFAPDAVPSQESSPSTKSFPAAPRFTLKDYDGNDVSLVDFSGQPVVINTWATWCPFCRDELPDFADVGDEFAGQVPIVAINRGEPRQTAKDWTDVYRLTDRITFLLDPTDAWYEATGGFGMPETLFIDKDGRVRSHARGPITKDEFRRLVQALDDGTLGTEEDA